MFHHEIDKRKIILLDSVESLPLETFSTYTEEDFSLITKRYPEFAAKLIKRLVSEKK
jgi:hypothetical protein